MSRRTLRQQARVCYFEPEEPSLDEYLFCELCADYVFEYCAIHGPLLVIPDDKVPSKPKYPSFVPRAALTIPHVFLHLARSIIPGAGIGVFTTLTLPRGVRFGPYRGLRTETVDSMYCWQIYDRNNKRSHVVDAADASRSNWMRYVNCSRHWCEQNLVAYQYKGQLYYRTIKIIPRFTELMVFYGSEFANILRVNLAAYNAPTAYAAKFGARVSKKPKIAALKDIKDATTNKRILEDERNEQTETITIREPKISTKKTEVEKPVTTSKILETCDKVDINLNKYGNVVTSIVNDVCEEKSTNNTSLEQNISSVSSSKNKPFSCDICNKCFSYKHVLKRHIRIHSGDKPYQCNICKKRYTEKGNLNKHIRTHSGDKPYQCNICNKFYTQKGYLKTHIRTHSGDKPYQCNICKKRYTEKGNLNKHIRTHSGDKPYQCNICNKFYTQKGYLKTHIRTHSGDKPYQCNICNKCFIQKGHFNSHIRTHSGDKPYLCNVCNKRFIQKSDLIKHIRTHSGEKPYQCNICEKCFTQKSSLQSHIRTHSGDKPYQCNICKTRFNRKGNLQTHIRTHSGDKPYQCNVCKTRFTQKSSLKAHIRTHSGDKPYQCNICSKYFSYKQVLKTHILTHSGDKPYQCNICNTFFTQKGYLKTHIRTHSGDKPYLCNVCNKRFSQSSSCSRHIRIHKR